MTLSTSESLTWGLRLSKVNSTRHKNVILRVAHGDIYTKEKLHRFGLIDSPICPRCDLVETLQHKFLDCNYVKRIWEITLSSLNRITTSDPRTEPLSKAVCGGYLTSSSTIITLNAEIMQRILVLKDEEQFLVHPKHFVKNALGYLLKKEKKPSIKNEIKSILEFLSGP